MKTSVTKSPLRTRVKSADRSARWREAHPDHLDTRLIDRFLLQSVFHVLTDERLVEKPVAASILTAIVDAAGEGLAERGHQGTAATKSVAARMRQHSSGERTVRRAMMAREILATPIKPVSE